MDVVGGGAIGVVGCAAMVAAGGGAIAAVGCAAIGAAGGGGADTDSINVLVDDGDDGFNGTNG